MNQVKRVLVTGAAGFIGARTVEELLNAGIEVVGVDNMNDYYDPRLKEHRLSKLIGREGFKFERLDIEDRDGVERLFDKHEFDAVVNLAARAGVRYSVVNPHVYMSTNATGSLNLLEAMRRKGVKKLVLASTSSLYAGQRIPFSEDLPVNTPISPYAATKKAAEMMAFTYHYLFGLDVSILRYFTVYGPAGRPDMSIFRFIRSIQEGVPIEVHGDGTQSRDFTYVDDAVRGTVLALAELGYEVLNLGGGQKPLSINSVIEKLERLIGRSAKVVYTAAHQADMYETAADTSKANRLLGWRAEVGMDEGLARTVDWHQKNLDWLKDLRN